VSDSAGKDPSEPAEGEELHRPELTASFLGCRSS
jgi:hypothetical protein